MKTRTVILLVVGALVAAGLLWWALSRESDGRVPDPKGGVEPGPLPAGATGFTLASGAEAGTAAGAMVAEAAP